MEIQEGRCRPFISHVSPQVECGRFPIKRVIGEQVIVTADIFADGYSQMATDLLFRHHSQLDWLSVPMVFLENDRWKGHFTVEALGIYFYTLMAWVDYFSTWQNDLQKKFKVGTDISVDLLVGIKMIEEALQAQADTELRGWLENIQTAKNEEIAINFASDPVLHRLMRARPSNQKWVAQYSKNLSVTVDPPKALFSAWYELFPRSTSAQPGKHGTFKDCQRLLPEIAQMGFNVLYFPPIHPIGTSKRKGRNNQSAALEIDLGSPWAIGSQEGGHDAIHPELGTLEDFKQLVVAAQELGIDIALDLAFQCSLDHPYLQQHPNWFNWRPDHTIQYAENPPKKYEDIVPFNFETDNWKDLWEELKQIVLYWIDKGIRLFRVDNPHTKPFAFWEWLIGEIKQAYPEVIFLAEAFTRSKIMYHLAKLGFTQSYTYFTWRHTKQELIDYMTEITNTEIREYFRPNFWPNTPDILTEELQQGGRAMFLIRLILAATLSSNYGLYGPVYELLIKEALPGTEEYLNAEKYESKYWERSNPEGLKEFITQINRIRHENRALQATNNIKFYEIDQEQIIYYGKCDLNSDYILLIVVSLDAFNPQTATLTIPLKDLGLTPTSTYTVQELFSGCQLIWEGEKQTMTLDPKQIPAYIFRIYRESSCEVDFKYFNEANI